MRLIQGSAVIKMGRLRYHSRAREEWGTQPWGIFSCHGALEE